MSAHRHSTIFNENCPRPPVPGEETDVGLPPPGYPYPPPWTFQRKTDSPVLTPRRSSLAAGSRHTTVADLGAPLGFEPEGSCGGGDIRGRYPHEQPSPPPYLRWAQNLHYLLEDPDGVDLFRTFLKQEGQLDTLNFWFACEGLKKQTDQERVSQLVKVIYRKYLQKSQLAITEDLRKEVIWRVKEEGEIHSGVFDGVQAAVEQLISNTTYPNFLKSDLYLQHVQSMQNGPSDNGESPSSSGSNSSPPGLGGCPLPTLHEDAELSTNPLSASSMPPPSLHGGPPLRLTKDMLMATERRRATELKPKPEAYAGMYLQRPYHSPFLSHPNNPHVLYNSYNPVSRQDSELQSLSSDARTESDNMSLTDSSIDGMSSIGRSRTSRRQHLRHSRQMKESASINRDPFSHRTVIPRTQILHKDQTHSLKPDQFAAILIQKLESVKKEQDAQDKLDRKLLENDMDREDAVGSESGVGETAVSSRALADALREKLMIEDDNDQAILDQHVSRVWSDLTPSRSPGFSSPRPKSPDARRRVPTAASTLLPSAKPTASGPVPHPYQARPSYSSRHIRKEKDVFSTFSSDSGNVHDYMEGSEHKHHVPKSKSVPDYVETLKQEGYPDARYRDRPGTCRRSVSRKTLTDQTDSGVSVVSDTPPALGVSAVPGVPTQMKDSKVLSWLLESEREKQHTATGDGSWHARSESSSKHRARVASATSPITPRHSRKSVAGSTSAHSRSDSLERGVAMGPMGPMGAAGVGPAQPFVADPSMPPLPQPHTATQLEEARRRLMDESHRQRPRYSVGSKGEPHSNPSTLRRTSRPASGRADTQDSTTVVFTFCEEQFPYRTKIPNSSVTLRQFKEYLPKKGNYRYFFKTNCEELDMQVIQEEVTDDNDLVPLWEGKIMAQVKPID
ncbi:Axin [Frankliniella occidentalis]|uniref:Axin isoform X1 n=1 Tax=Frankliniella occidentalis TaxID=133901 RepID=A0A6J1SDX0_FRAOC|nr:axin isoform X1 [Frankliniella occidentalis]XP_026279370.1 axin isoform X1 [Frankliniella occidentalis]XP_052122888.1 axin isoform X1 [Frankliniella occidentalis]KAE8747590.1 Axin [Frankliniella occidentalis]